MVSFCRLTMKCGDTLIYTSYPPILTSPYPPPASADANTETWTDDLGDLSLRLLVFAFFSISHKQKKAIHQNILNFFIARHKWILRHCLYNSMRLCHESKVMCIIFIIYFFRRKDFVLMPIFVAYVNFSFIEIGASPA